VAPFASAGSKWPALQEKSRIEISIALKLLAFFDLIFNQSPIFYHGTLKKSRAFWSIFSKSSQMFTSHL
jgi:hypothetical protein